MNKRWIAPVLALLAALTLAACGGSAPGGVRTADLTGRWVQEQGEGEFYQVVEITEDTIRVYWHLMDDNSEHLYWVGSYEPPKSPVRSYKWVSENRLEQEPKKSPWARHEDTLTFTYKNSGIHYTIFMGNLKMGVTVMREGG